MIKYCIYLRNNGSSARKTKKIQINKKLDSIYYSYIVDNRILRYMIKYCICPGNNGASAEEDVRRPRGSEGGGGRLRPLSQPQVSRGTRGHPVKRRGVQLIPTGRVLNS